MMIGLSIGMSLLMPQLSGTQLQRTPPDITAPPPSRLPAPDAPRIPGTPFIDAVMKHDPEFDLDSIPLAQWLDARDIQEIPWKTRTENAELRMDQRLEVAYTATLQAKDVNNLFGGDLYFIAGVTDAGARSLVPPKVVHRSLDGRIPENKELRFSDNLIALPGEYVLYLVLYDRQTGRHNTMKRRMTVTPLSGDPLPDAGKGLPQLEFFDFTDRERGTLQFFKGLSLPVTNRRMLRIELISLLNPPEQWSDHRRIVRSHIQQTAAALNALSQLRLAQGSVSVTGLDIAHGAIAFQQANLDQLNWEELTAVLNKIADDNTVSLTTMQTGGGSAFFRESLDRELSASRDAMKVLVVLSGVEVFEPSSSIKPLDPRKNCDCRVYHLRFRYDSHDASDDIGKILKPLGPRTFDITAPRELRKALAEIIRDLSNL
jgi:hypothetical protein